MREQAKGVRCYVELELSPLKACTVGDTTWSTYRMSIRRNMPTCFMTIRAPSFSSTCAKQEGGAKTKAAPQRWRGETAQDHDWRLKIQRMSRKAANPGGARAEFWPSLWAILRSITPYFLLGMLIARVLSAHCLRMPSLAISEVALV